MYISALLDHDGMMKDFPTYVGKGVVGREFDLWGARAHILRHGLGGRSLVDAARAIASRVPRHAGRRCHQTCSCVLIARFLMPLCGLIINLKLSHSPLSHRAHGVPSTPQLQSRTRHS